MIRILIDALSNPTTLLEQFGTSMPSDQIRKLLGRGNRLAATLSGSPAERVKIVRGLVAKVVVEETALTVKMCSEALLGGRLPSCASDTVSHTLIELKAAVAFRQRGAENQAGAARSSAAEPPIEMRSGVDQGNRARSRVV